MHLVFKHQEVNNSDIAIKYIIYITTKSVLSKKIQRMLRAKSNEKEKEKIMEGFFLCLGRC